VSPAQDPDPQAASPEAALEPQPCPHCGKLPELCVCEGIEPIENRIGVLILQHPQEQDVGLGTARLAALHLKNATMKIGLSWASLSKAVGRTVEAKRWGVIYLGSAQPAVLNAELDHEAELIAVDAKGELMPDQRAALMHLEGIVVLDGSWSQAKALWWRNAWMLKTQRLVLNPATPSRYGKLRKEPRTDSLSTLESIGLALRILERKPAIENALLATFEKLLERYRALPKPPAPKKDWRNANKRGGNPRGITRSKAARAPKKPPAA
jgi:DTW domain-containing protein YfiP